MQMVWCVVVSEWTTSVTNVLLAVICASGLVLLGYRLAVRTQSAGSAALRALTEAIDRSQMIIEMAMDCTILKVNSNYTRVFGYTLDEVAGRHASMLVPEEDLRSGTYDAFWDALRRGEFQSGQFQRLKKNGHPVWIEASYNPILDAHGDPVKVVGLLTDVTARVHMERERERQEEALRKSEQFLEETGSLAGVGGWEVDLTTGAVTWLPETYRLIGADPSYQPTMEAALDLYTDDCKARLVHAIEQARQAGTGWDLELSLRRFDGRMIWARVVGRVRFEAGKAVALFGAFQDITLRVEERNALQWATERAELASESGGIGIWEWDILKDEMILDARVMRLYDLKPYAYRPVTCRTWMQYLHSEDRAAAEQDLQDSLEGKRPFDSWFRIVRDDGSIRFVRTTGKIIRDSTGQPVKMLGTNLDMTERKQAEDALRDQASLLDLCHDAIFVRDLNGTIRFWNKGAQEIYGFSRKYAQGKVSHQLLDTIFPAELAEIERIFLEKERWEGELNHVTRSGRRVVVDSRWAMKRDESGRPVAVMEINSDITERKQTEEALRQSTEKEQLLLHGVRDYSIILLDPQGNVATWNEGAEHIKGYKAEEILGRHISVLYPPEAVAANKPERVLEEARRNGRFEEVDWRMRKDGTRFWANVVITALRDAGGRLRGYGKVTRDITDRRLAEEATEKARVAADLANRAKSDFLANMSHEVRTPVNAIMGMAHLALRANPEPRQREYLVKIDTAAQRLLSTINDILDFSKMEAGKLKLERIEFALSEVMQNLRDIVEQKAREKHLALEFSIAPDIPPGLTGDPLRLGQVLINLVNNAVKFTERGEVRVTVERESSAEPLRLRFSVSDTGIGMTALQMENLFQAFHQADTSFTRQYGGTGLGLAISKQLVELMGGAIHIESEFGSGSTFSFAVPFGVASFHAAKPAPGLAGPRRAVKILIVDDNESTRDELVQLLRHHGQQAYTTASGEEALAILVAAAKRDDPFGLIVMDWRLPGMNGIEASRRIRQNVLLQPTPIIIMISAFDRHDIAPEASEVTFDKFLLKPVKEESFLDVVWSLLDARKSAPTASPPHSSPPPQLDGRRVLLVEDNDLNRDLATELLTDLGLTVTAATNGQAAVDSLLSQNVDLVLMDIQMPVMDGLTATTKIRADSRFAQLPIIAMTAHAMTGDYERSIAAGMNDHITKPIDPKLLTSTLLRWMPNRPAGRLPQENTPWVVPDHLGPFHLAAALKRTNNKPHLLRKLLLGFRQQYSGAVAELNALVTRENWAEAQRYVHSLKSIAATLEDSPLADSAAVMEKALVEGKTTGLTPLIEDLSAKLNPAIAAAASLDHITAAAV
jgi:two-component system, sensor histidine kinase and response regulator